MIEKKEWWSSQYLCNMNWKKKFVNPSPPDLITNSFWLSVIEFLWCYFGEFGNGSTNNWIIDVFLYPNQLSAWIYVDIKKKKSIFPLGQSNSRVHCICGLFVTFIYLWKCCFLAFFDVFCIGRKAGIKELIHQVVNSFVRTQMLLQPMNKVNQGFVESFSWICSCFHGRFFFITFLVFIVLRWILIRVSIMLLVNIMKTNEPFNL